MGGIERDDYSGGKRDLLSESSKGKTRACLLVRTGKSLGFPNLLGLLDKLSRFVAVTSQMTPIKTRPPGC